MNLSPYSNYGAARAYPLMEETSRSSSDVRFVQRALNRIAEAGLTEDGIAGARTRAAVARFQRAEGLTADGRIGAALISRLRAKAGSKPTAAGPPALLATEQMPPSATYYVDIRHGGEQGVQSMSGIFLPAGFRAEEQIDAIVYLHGFAYAPRMTIQHYWNARNTKYFTLREGLNRTGKNVVLCAPTLGPRSQAGRLREKGGLDWYLDRVLAALRAHVFRNRPVALRNLVLACHSGGGFPMRRAASNAAKYRANLRECWGFDCLYNSSDPQGWTDWAKANPNAKLFVHYAGGTAQYSTALKTRRLPNVSIERASTPHHNEVPLAHWEQRIRAALR